jgi:ERCC4-type nuclease
MLIKIDNRETEMLNKIKYLIDNTDNLKDIKVKVECLPLGDFIINDDETDIIIIERKTLNDLSASIKDGRYDEQSYRLDGINHHNHNITYLIEGYIQQPKNILLKERTDKNMIYSAMASICYFKGFTVMRSFDISESAFMICNLASKIMKTKDRKLYYSITNETHSQDTPLENMNTIDKNYCSVVKKIKKDNITKDNISEIMLSQIPGISSQTACAIFDKFKNINNLLKSIEHDRTCLNDICTIDKNQKSRKISKKTIENILLFLSE